MIDIAIASSLVSIFFIVIFSIFDSYINLKKSKEYSMIDYVVIKELDRNLSYEELMELELKEYLIDINSIKDLENKNIVQLLKNINNKEFSKELYYLNVLNQQDNYIEYEYLKNDEKIGFIKYKG